MNRIAETFFSIVGVLMFGLLFLGSGVLFLSIDNESGTQELVQEFLNDENITNVSVEQVVSFLNYGTIYLLAVSLICTILGIIAISFLKGNKRPKSASKILIVTAILGTVLTIITGLLGGIAYLIAGLITISKKGTINK